MFRVPDRLRPVFPLANYHLGYHMRCLLAIPLAVLLATAGCAIAPPPPGVPLVGPAPYALANPVLIPSTDHDLVWEQMVDVIDDYFKIEREDRVQVVGGVVTEGRLETHSRVGSTWLEPWHHDSASRQEKLQSTLQTIRRRATLTVRPAEGGYLIDVAVFKEREHLHRPQFSTAGSAILRHDSSIKRYDIQSRPDPITLDWIPIGRDPALEQRIVAQLQRRFAAMPTAPIIAPAVPPVSISRLPPVR